MNKRERNKQKGRLLRQTPRGRANSLFQLAKDRAKDEGRAFELTIDWVEARIWRGCAVTGLPFIMEGGRGSGRGSPRSPSIDRIDASRGYELDNCRVVCNAINKAAGDWGWHAFTLILIHSGWKKTKA
jgi:hypothetical protein